MTDTSPNDVIDLEYAEKLFVHVYSDLGRSWEAVCQYTDDQLFEQFNLDKSYMFLNMARLVRQLVNDGIPLMHLANRRVRHRFVFFVPEYGSASDADTAAFNTAKPYVPDISLLPPGKYWKPVNIDAFLGYSSLILGGGGPNGNENYQVPNGHLIDYFANCAGGVHLAPYMDRARISQLTRFDLQVIVGDSGLVQTALGNMIAATLRALAPLRDKITDLHKAASAPR